MFSKSLLSIIYFPPILSISIHLTLNQHFLHFIELIDYYEDLEENPQIRCNCNQGVQGIVLRNSSLLLKVSLMSGKVRLMSYIK